MGVYLVAYDLRQPSCDYEALFDAIDSYNSEQMLESAFLIETPADAETVHRHLAGAVRSNRAATRSNPRESNYTNPPVVDLDWQRVPVPPAPLLVERDMIPLTFV